MNLSDARNAVVGALRRMDELYQSPVFDEWILVKLAREGGAILAYEGPRAESYKRKFKSDIAPLQAEVSGREMAIGDFEFAPNAQGDHYDVGLRIGSAGYLFCNNTAKSMTDIRQHTQWLAAQKPFLALANKFREDPLL